MGFESQKVELSKAQNYKTNSDNCFYDKHLGKIDREPEDAQSVHLQASVFPVGTLVPLPTLWHSFWRHEIGKLIDAGDGAVAAQSSIIYRSLDIVKAIG